MKRTKVDGGASKKQKYDQFDEILPILLNYLPGPIVGVLTQVCSDWRRLILSRLESYCNDLCHHPDMLAEHRCCIYQIYDFWQRGFITQERYDALRLRWGFTDKYLLERGGVLWIPKIGDRVGDVATHDTFFNLHSYHGRAVDFRLNCCDADETDFISIQLYRKVFDAPICKQLNISLENLIEARVPIPVIEHLIVQNKISDRWFGKISGRPVDHILQLLKSPFEPQLRQINRHWPQAAINWSPSSVGKYRAIIDALVRTPAGIKAFLMNYRGPFDEWLNEILDSAVQGPVDCTLFLNALEFEKILDAKGFLPSTYWDRHIKFDSHWDQYTKRRVKPDFQRTAYLLMHQKLHPIIIRKFKLDTTAEENILEWLCISIGTCNGVAGSLEVDPRCDEVLFLIKQLAPAIKPRAYQDLVGRIYFPGPAPPELLTSTPIVDLALAAYNYLWLRNHSTA